MSHRAASPAEAAKCAITRDESNATARPRPALPSQHQGVAAAGGVIAGCWSGVATIATVAQGEDRIGSPAIPPRRFRGPHLRTEVRCYGHSEVCTVSYSDGHVLVK